MKLYSFTSLLAYLYLSTLCLNMQEKKIEEIGKLIVEELVAENYDDVTSHFNIVLKQQLKPTQIEQAWTSALTNFGEYEKISSVSTEVVQGYRIVKVRCKFKNSSANIESTFNAENEVIGLWIKP